MRVATGTSGFRQMTQDMVLEILKKIQAELRSHTRALATLQQDVRMIRAAVNDIAKVGVTSGEIEAIHFDLNRLQQQFVELDTRINELEAKS
jgi:peptidoglycan hydrolase CwlO-like protein